MARGISIILALCLCYSTFASDHVPVLIWNTNQAQGAVPAVSALQYVSYTNFQAKYLEAFKPNNILLFLQDTLSVEDLTSHTNELHHIKDWMESGHSLFLPNVEDASHLVHDLPAHGYNVVKLDHDAGLTLKQKDKNLVVVDLPHTQTNPSRRRALQKADEVMENVISKIGAQRDFTIIFTGRKPSVEERNDQYVERVRVSRSLQAAPETELGYHFANCTKMYLRQNLTFNFFNKDGTVGMTLPIPEDTATTDTSDCSEPQILLSTYNLPIKIGGSEYTKVKIGYVFAKGKRSTWYLDYARVSFVPSKNAELVLNLQTKMDEVPFDMSFACSQQLRLVSNESFSTYPKVDLVLERVQMQAFPYDKNLNNHAFGNSWDCVGFFTVPIWCGLLTTLILVIILTIGLFMLSDIKTMDRFDDPKGQAISVPTNE